VPNTNTLDLAIITQSIASNCDGSATDYVAFFGLWSDVMNPTVLLLVSQLLVFISRP
jgi:hypothetical protein